MIRDLEIRIEELENQVRVLKWDCERLKHFIKYINKEEGINIPKDIAMLIHSSSTGKVYSE